MMRFEQLHPSRDAVEIADCLSRLYGELFGAEAVLPTAAIGELLELWESHRQTHWAFRARDEGETVAFFTLAESFAFFAHGAYGILNELWVAPDSRSRGVGSEVIDFCVEFARGRGWRRIDVSAPPMAQWDRTFAFYEKRGFILTGRKLKYVLGD
jgi:GNAT superfamily N-acetyltransferase